jgi:hypothetical protein
VRVGHDVAFRKRVNQSADQLLPENVAASLAPPLKTLRECFAVADALARTFQRRRQQTRVRLGAYAFVALFSFSVSSKLFPSDGWIALFASVLLTNMASYWLQTSRQDRWQAWHQDYRALAEGIRVQFYWRLAGLSASVGDHYLRHERGSRAWIRIALRNTSIANVPAASADATARFPLVMEYWVRNRERHFAQTLPRIVAERKRYESYIKALLITSVMLGAVTALVLILPTPLAHVLHEHEYLHKLLNIATEAMALAAVLLHLSAGRPPLLQLIQQCEQSALLFGLADKHLGSAPWRATQADAQGLFLELGKESLADNERWLSTRPEGVVPVSRAR